MRGSTVVSNKCGCELELVVYKGIQVLPVYLTGSMVNWYGCSHWYTRLFPESTLGSGQSYLQGKLVS